MEAPDSFMAQAAMAQEDEKDVAEAVVKYRRWKTKEVFKNLVFAGALLLVVFLASSVGRALFLNRDIGWLFEVLPDKLTDVGDFAAVLAPLVAIAVAIERFLEHGFDYLEKNLISVADFLKAPVDFLKVLQDEYKEAYNAVKEASREVKEEGTQGARQTLEEARQKLVEVEETIRNSVKTPEYTAWKRFLATFIAFLLGLLLAVFGDLGMLRTIGVPSPRIFDMFVTGMVIGAGPGPMHSIIGILQNGKEALGQVANMGKVNQFETRLAEMEKELKELRGT